MEKINEKILKASNEELGVILEDISKNTYEKQRLIYSRMSKKAKEKIEVNIQREYKKCISDIITIMREGNYENL